MKLSDLVVKLNDELKQGILDNIIERCSLILEKEIKNTPDLKYLIKMDSYFKLNLELNGITGKILFPAFLYLNSFRLQIIREINNNISKFKTLNDLEYFLVLRIKSTSDIKKGGFKRKNLETLRFYLLNFNQIAGIDTKYYLSLLNEYDSKYIQL